MIYQQTANDVSDFLLDYLGAYGAEDSRRGVSADARRDVLRALQSGHREFCTAHRWAQYYTQDRVITDAPYDTGTITYTNSTLTVTLASGTWPTWAAHGTIVVGSVKAKVKTRSSGTVLILDPVLHFADDIAAGTSYTLYRDTYPLPDNYAANDTPYAENNWGGLDFIHPSVWLRNQRYVTSSANTPTHYTIRGDSERPGLFCVSFYPYPDQQTSIDYIYHRRPRPLQIVSYETGTVTVVGASTTVTGTGTAFDSRMVGSILRLSSSSSTLPTGFEGANPSVQDRIITEVTDETTLVVDTAFDASYSGVKYRISDPIDVEQGMLNAFRYCCLNHLADTRIKKDKESIQRSYNAAKIQAKEADNRIFQERYSGGGGYYRQRLADMPIDFT